MLTTSQLANITTILSRALQSAYRDALSENWAQAFVQEELTSKSQVTFPWVYDVGLLRETEKGVAPTYQELSGWQAEMELRLWEDGIKVSIYDFAGDDTRQILEKARAIGQNAAFLNRDLIIDALRLGDTNAYVMYDGENYFSNNHIKKQGSTITYDNLLSGALTAANFQTARTAMMRFPSDFGADRPLNLQASHLIVPPELEYTARELMNNAYSPAETSLGAGRHTENVLEGMAQVISDSRLQDADDWYLICNRTRVRPFIHLKHRDFAPFTIQAETSPQDPAVRDHHEYRWWGRTMEAVWPSHPYLAIKVVN